MALYITGSALASGGSKAWFTDQNGSPRLYFGDETWMLLVNGGRWGGTYQTDVDNYFASRGGQGYTGLEMDCFSSNNPNFSLVHTDGADWDGVYPFTSTNNPSSGFNNTFWARRDYLINSAAAQGITVVMNVTTTALGVTGNWMAGLTNTQWSDFGTALGNRYKTGFPNLLWIVGDDYFGTIDSNLGSFRTALRATGDTHLMSIQNYQETTSRVDLFDGTKDPVSWDVHAQFEWGYSYNVSYDAVEKAQTYVPSASDDVQSRVPPMWSDGVFLNSSVGTGQTDVRLERQNLWWALSSGAAGVQTGDNNIFGWASGAAALVTGSFYANVAKSVIAAFTGLPGWHKLVADTSSALVTAGRGTHASALTSGGSATAYTANTDNYVTASRAPDGSLAVIYSGKAFNITIDQTKMQAGYTAKWIDPVNGATQAATPGSTYNSATPGNNSAGDPDWVLALQGPAPVRPSFAYQMRFTG